MKFTLEKLKECGYFWVIDKPAMEFMLFTPKDGLKAVTLETEEVEACAIDSIGVLTDENVIRVFPMVGECIDSPIEDGIEITMLRAVWEEIPE